VVRLIEAFSHVSLVNTAFNLSEDIGPAEHRKSEGEPDARAGVGGKSAPEPPQARGSPILSRATTGR